MPLDFSQVLRSSIYDYNDMGKSIKSFSKVNWPTTEPQDNFKFSANDESGVFEFKFKWLNGRWNCWCTFPDGTVKEAGVYPNVINWAGDLNYGLIFATDLANISRAQLFLTELYIIKWQ